VSDELIVLPFTVLLKVIETLVVATVTTGGGVSLLHDTNKVIAIIKELKNVIFIFVLVF